jgi:hypothetical protein
VRLFLILILAFSVSTIWAGDKEKKAAQNEKNPVKVEQSYVKDKGKPADPGAHGRANAASKQAAIRGKGSGKTEDLEVTPLTDKSDGGEKKAKGKEKKDGNNSR